MVTRLNTQGDNSRYGPLIVGLAGAMPSESELEILAHSLVAGVLLFDRNFESVEQLTELCKVVRTASTPPLLIWVDQEGGRVQRFKGDGFSNLPPCAALGELYDNDPELALQSAYDTGWLMATELRLCGVDSSLAPVVDIGGSNDTVIADRALHHQPLVIARLAASYMRGMKAAGMTGMAKHYPGHGLVPGDTHVEDCVDQRSLQEIMEHDLVPYKFLMEQELLHAVMVAHVSYPAVDIEAAGYSRFWLRRVLRQTLGFRGLVVSDDLGMRAAAIAGDICDRAEAAIGAGCDMLIVSESEQVATEVLSRLPAVATIEQSIVTVMRGTAPSNSSNERQVQRQRYQVREKLQRSGLLP